MLIYFLVGAVAGVLALGVYVRLAPLHATTQHDVPLPQGIAGAVTGIGSHTVIREDADPMGSLKRLDQLIRATARTKRIAGSVEAGRVTYVTRSRVCGFPDFTTVEARPDAGQLVLCGRLRFGKSDLGVNRARIEGWLAALDGDTPTS